MRLATALAVLSGALLATQARINGALSQRIQAPVATAAISFSVGTAVLLVLAVATRSLPRAWARRGSVTWWSCLGGLGGAFLVAVSADAVPLLGVALLTVATTAGLTTGGLGVDRVGLAPGGRRATTPARAAGAVLAVVAVVVAALGTRLGHPLDFVLVAVAGVGVAVQQALNGRLRESTGEPVVAALVSFVVGTAALVVVATAQGWPTAGYPGLDAGYLWLGGVFGAIYITLSAATVRVLGVLRLSLASLAGQLAGALVLDALTPGAGVRPVTLLAVLLTFAAVAVAGGRPRRAA